ncbi:hypothetical protein DA2_1615 [Desulfovibrio sp. A2]|nr:hypothetical protein DA2_1615 [Desulfovibrio sp. A2]
MPRAFFSPITGHLMQHDPRNPRSSRISRPAARQAAPAGQSAPMLAALQDAQDAPEQLSGVLDRVIFHNEENGYTVLRLRPLPKGDMISVVGHMVSPQPGASLKLVGRWVNNPRFGRQFSMESYENLLPASVEGIRHYLGSGLIKGVGESMAARIVEAFGEDTFRVLDEEPNRLLRVSGVGSKTLERIKAGWSDHQGIRDLIMFLQPHGVSTAYAVRIYRHYGQQALSVVRENPYRLAMDIHGIGFHTADTVAEKLGFSRDSELRAEAGTLYTLQRLNDDGHVYVPHDALIAQTSDQLDIRADLVEDSLRTLEIEERIVIEEMDGELGIFLSRYHHYETKIAYYLQRVLRSPKAVRFDDPEAIIAKVLDKLSITLAPEQLEAVRTATRAKVMVLTGGPGTGKTTIINAIIKVFAETGAKILLAAPTGRAAKRMSETSGRESKTIHRLLEYSPKEDGFARNEDNPLACGLLVVDEASMMDTMLMYHLLKAVPLGATLLFVGDVHQLPSVGPGNVLRDVIASGVVPVVELVEVFRQAAESEIICNAHRINHGEVPPLDSSRDRLSDFYFIRQDDPEKVVEMIVELVRDHIPRRFGLHPVDDIQVLTPMHKGAVGAGNLNVRLQQALNGQTLCVQRGERQYRLDDKVMQIRNNYDKDVFNGDIGRICLVDPKERQLTVRFDERNVPYAWEELDEIVPAYAISVHKSQGSEYPAVVIPVLTQHYMLLQRNLIYTGVTRGKRLVVLVGEPRALSMAVKNNRMHKRHTRLARRLALGLGVG